MKHHGRTDCEVLHTLQQLGAVYKFSNTYIHTEADGTRLPVLPGIAKSTIQLQGTYFEIIFIVFSMIFSELLACVLC